MPVYKKKLSKPFLFGITLMLIISLAVSGCTEKGREKPSVNPQPSTANGTIETGNSSQPAEEYIYGTAAVEEIEILILESLPAQMNVIAKGNLPDPCTKIDNISSKREGNTFKIRIATIRPRDKICAQVLVPFEETIPLDVLGLKAGNYTVDVNGIQKTFEFAVDNEIPAPPEPPEKENTFTKADSAKGAELKNGTVFYILLPENPSTGYQWNLTADAGLKLLSDEFKQNQTAPGLVGAGGIHEWKYEAASKGSWRITGIYKRPWEKESGDEERFELEVRVA